MGQWRDWLPTFVRSDGCSVPWWPGHQSSRLCSASQVVLLFLFTWFLKYLSLKSCISLNVLIHFESPFTHRSANLVWLSPTAAYFWLVYELIVRSEEHSCFLYPNHPSNLQPDPPDSRFMSIYLIYFLFCFVLESFQDCNLRLATGKY